MPPIDQIRSRIEDLRGACFVSSPHRSTSDDRVLLVGMLNDRWHAREHAVLRVLHPMSDRGIIGARSLVHLEVELSSSTRGTAATSPSARPWRRPGRRIDREGVMKFFPLFRARIADT